MSTGCNNKYNEENGTIHHTTFDNEGRHSFDYDPLTGDVTHDHSVTNKPHHVEKWPDSNIWDEIEKDAAKGLNEND